MLLNKSDVQNILPHREPILLIDSVYELTPGLSIQARTKIQPDWPIFQGHFPEGPILPGIYITEALAQAAGIMLLSLPEHSGKLPLLFQIQSMRFLRSVYPGDELELHATIKTSAGNAMYDCLVSAFVADKKIASGILTLSLK